MPPPSADQIGLIRQFEPILFFARGERFFPSDAKRYVKHCALWKGKAPFETLQDWGNVPVIATDKIAAVESERKADQVFLGEKAQPGGAFKFLVTPANEECFLEMGGWRTPSLEIPGDNRDANLEQIVTRYANETELKQSQFWYHAEFFDTVRLRGLFNFVLSGGGHDFMDLQRDHPDRPAVLKMPALICYYLFFPGHEEGLSGCEAVPTARDFASFAGDWTCITLLLDKSTPEAVYRPRYVGLSNRNVGIVMDQGQEIRVGMRIFPWELMDFKPEAPDTPRFAVALGTHGLYVATEIPGIVKPFTSDDSSRNSCGLAPPPLALTPPLGWKALWGPYVFVLKIILGGALGNFFSRALGGIGTLPGLVGGLLWGLDEIPSTPPQAPDTRPSPMSGSVTDTIGTNGTVVHPVGKRPPEIPAGDARAEAWRSVDGFVVPDDPPFVFTVDRDTQILWPDEPGVAGYTGRWGQRVENDSGRRSGMRFPNFWRMFFDTLVVSDPKPTPPPPPSQQAIAFGPATLAGGDDNNRNDNTFRQRIEAAQISVSGSKVRVTFRGGDSEGFTIGAAYIGLAAPTGDPYDFGAVPVQLTFDAGTVGANVGATSDKTSDWATLALDKTKPLLVSWHVNSAEDTMRYGSNTGCTCYRKSGNDAAAVDASGYTDTGLSTVAVKQVDVQF